MHSFFKYLAVFFGATSLGSTYFLANMKKQIVQVEETKKEKVEIIDPRLREDISIVKQDTKKED
ncbi:hypothetical protein MHLP_02390 [Candidatus Mycoplasma haematolamae str. Purdue]|uniref:Uncharacterized protein n=1 Tax=Mycoplasma haematolamae (strain Purdue) TaxID=1212765 RepID=I7BJL7_MYCHA|nr:hypothetical protein [Candidatus Mycoplasma haematolamae]AFO52058.1 hypothetical protein MHLP_02390 [Candidatus Mycoplasma haematolamae str. Purdue]